MILWWTLVAHAPHGIYNPNFLSAFWYSFERPWTISLRDFFCPGSSFVGGEEVSIGKDSVDPLYCISVDSMSIRREFKFGNIDTISETVMDDPASFSRGSVFKTSSLTCPSKAAPASCQRFLASNTDFLASSVTNPRDWRKTTCPGELCDLRAASWAVSYTHLRAHET